MPWKEIQKVNQRTDFVMEAIKTENFRELCRRYGISAKTGYKWKARALKEGTQRLEDRSRRPRSHSAELGEAVLLEIVRLKGSHPHWGPRKIRALYERKHGGQVPSESSFKRILERAGMTVPRRIRKAAQAGRLSSGFKADKPNDVWTVDFKGWWRDREGLRVEPLTVRDEYSRMILELRALESCGTESVRQCFERLFEQYGLPGAIRSDNGAPFASTSALLGLSRLSTWWLALGIHLERGRPAHPQDNGAHERMHWDIWRELEAKRVGRDQAAFDVWREEYNTERPHESLAMRVPADFYRPSERAYEGTPADIDYQCMDRRMVNRQCGKISYRTERIFLSTALGGWSVGLSARSDGLVEVWFSTMLLGYIDPQTSSFSAADRTGRQQVTHPHSTAGGAS
jgi:putative transposase